MRGKGAGGSGAAGVSGITPAYAGKSSLSEVVYGRGWDHPRVCGEKLKSDDADVTYKGSPPRMRGKALISIKDVKQAGITPAYAGKRCFGGLFCFEIRDHPRVCGEKA